MVRPDWKTILIVDDDVDVLLALGKRLHSAGLDVLTASNGTDAVQLVRNTTVDAIILDVAMPGGMDGLGVAATLQDDPRTSQIPIIFVTGTADANFKQKCAAVGGKYFLAKPYDADLLIHALEGVFGQDELAELWRISRSKRRQPVS